ncbi:MAG: alpha-glucuronidase, partial [Lewinella sp.]|nr:alpha-glucuronidase [Lewinella sp.]
RTSSGSDALGQYAPAFQAVFADIDSCPPEFLLWFHHVPWDHVLATGRTLWDELCVQYHRGADEAAQMQVIWANLEGAIDEERFQQVAMHLSIQAREARWWRDACLAYFQTFAQRPIPADLEPPAHPLDYYQSLTYPYAPGIRPRW